MEKWKNLCMPEYEETETESILMLLMYTVWEYVVIFTFARVQKSLLIV